MIAVFGAENSLYALFYNGCCNDQELSDRWEEVRRRFLFCDGYVTFISNRLYRIDRSFLILFSFLFISGYFIRNGAKFRSIRLFPVYDRLSFSCRRGCGSWSGHKLMFWLVHGQQFWDHLYFVTKRRIFPFREQETGHLDAFDSNYLTKRLSWVFQTLYLGIPEFIKILLCRIFDPNNHIRTCVNIGWYFD